MKEETIHRCPKCGKSGMLMDKINKKRECPSCGLDEDWRGHYNPD